MGDDFAMGALVGIVALVCVGILWFVLDAMSGLSYLWHAVGFIGICGVGNVVLTRIFPKAPKVEQ